MKNYYNETNLEKFTAELKTLVFSFGGIFIWVFCRHIRGKSKFPLLKGESFRPFFSPTQERACLSRH